MTNNEDSNFWQIFLDFLESGGYWKITDNFQIPIFGIIAVLIASLLLFLISRLLRISIKRLVKKNALSSDIFNALRFGLRVFFGSINLWLILTFLSIESDYFLVITGIIATAIAFASMKTINNFIAGIWIAIVKPYILADYVKIGDNEGIIIDIGSTYTKIKHPDSTITLIPNLECLNSNILNYTRDVNIIQEKIARLQKELKKLTSSEKKTRDPKYKHVIKQIETELYEKQKMVQEIKEYESKLAESSTNAVSYYSDFMQKGRVVRYIFTLDLQKEFARNKDKLDVVCEKWKKEFNFKPQWELIDISYHFTYQFTIITPDPMDLINFKDDFISDIYKALY